MEENVKYFKCTKCRYILGTDALGYAEPCPMCRGYMMQVDESDPDVKAFRSVKIHKQGSILSGGRYARNR